jgi:hypothetical protein
MAFVASIDPPGVPSLPPGSDHFLTGVAGFFAPVPVAAGFAVVSVPVPGVDGVVVPMLDVSVVAGEPEFVVAFSGDFAGSLSPPHAIAPATRATLRTT